MAVNKKAKNIIDKFNTLKAQRSTWEDHWQDIANYFLPRKSNITLKRTRGDKRHDQIYDGTATHALELLSASLNGMLTNTISPWFVLKFRSEMMNQDDEANEWLESCAKVMQQVFARSNFQQEIFELYHELLAFGTSAMFISDDPKDDLRFKTIHISEIYITENERGMVDCLIRKFKVKNKNIPALYPDAELPISLTTKIKNNPYEDTDIIHMVSANDTPMGYENSKNMDFISCHVHEETGTLLRESGFREFPYVVPRYLKSSSNETYGRSPAMNALPDVKMLNTMSKTTIKAAQKQIDPPLMVPDDGFVLPVRTVPGGLNYYRSGTRDRIEPMNIGSNNPLGLQMEEQRRKAIRENFFVDQLMTVQGQNMTATEVMQRTEEKMRLLGPVLGRLQSELLQPLITRCFNLLLKNGKLPQIPEQIGDQDIEIEYVSPLAKAQKTQELSSIMRGIEIFGSLQNVAPVFDYLDIDGLVDHVKEVLGLPAKVMRSAAEVQQIQQNKQQQQIEQAQMQQAQQVAESAGKIAPALKAGMLNE
tara:strand:+ start:4919 stop:6523 length:1605 start_codon:yes stop_codon:yes gene_type:complete